MIIRNSGRTSNTTVVHQAAPVVTEQIITTTQVQTPPPVVTTQSVYQQPGQPQIYAQPGQQVYAQPGQPVYVQPGYDPVYRPGNDPAYAQNMAYAQPYNPNVGVYAQHGTQDQQYQYTQPGMAPPEQVYSQPPAYENLWVGKEDCEYYKFMNFSRVILT